MSYIEESLWEGEKVVKLFRLHWTARLWLALWIVLILPTFGIALLLAIYEWPGSAPWNTASPASG